MQVLKRKRRSRCTDGAVVSEYLLSHPIDHGFISVLEKSGDLSVKNLGELQMFTFRDEDKFTLKGMTGDLILYVTCKKEEKKYTEEHIDHLVSLCSKTQPE
ncbi:MAG: hypothetical protein LUQ07_06680 [Methanospirillum sp.]|nr:hypothetical protein [Methanospirillum sp.]